MNSSGTEPVADPSPYIVLSLPALWASALIENDWSGLHYVFQDEAERLEKWLQVNNNLSAIAVSDESFTCWHDGKMTMCLEFTFSLIPDIQPSDPPA